MAWSLGRTYSNFRIAGQARVHAGDNYTINNYMSDGNDTLPHLLRWLGASDPHSDHIAARKRYEPGTGKWFLASNEYQQWLFGQYPRLWVHGKAGCCKTVLSSTIIEDVLERFRDYEDVPVLYFYFSFSNSHKQKFEHLVPTLMTQLARRSVGLSNLREAFHKQEKDLETLERLLIAILDLLPVIYLVVDGIDECPEDEDTRQDVFHGMQRLSDACPNLRVLITSRKESDIQHFMSSYASAIVRIEESHVDRDIQLYVSNELQRDRKLSSLPNEVKVEIDNILTRKAGGMFRWAFCQLDQLKRLKILRPQYITKVLSSLPRDLEATYERILTNIGDYHEEALAALRWLAFSKWPLTLSQLVEACLTTSGPEPLVDEESRDALRDGLEDMLSSLILVEEGSPMYSPFALPEPTVRLAHASVREYLVSDQILKGSAMSFHLVQSISHFHLAQSCIAYLLYHGTIAGPCLPPHHVNDHDRFPLLQYASWNWCHHQRLAEESLPFEACLGLQMRLLVDFDAIIRWHPVWNTYETWNMERDGDQVYWNKMAANLAKGLGLIHTASCFYQ